VIDIKITHFPLHPDTPEEGLTLEKLFAGRNVNLSMARARLAKLMTEEGLPHGDRTMTYNSRLAQELASWAESRTGKGEIHNALFQAYFVHGINLALVEELVRIAGQVGLPENEAQEILDSRRFQGTVDIDWRRSRELGISGVPTFVGGDQRITGTQSYEILEKLVLEAGAVMRSISS
jgi:predicted DsbA family dithiol-disulfide isomerase